MPRRNVWLLVVLVLVCVPCHIRASRFGQIFSFAMRKIEQRSLKKVEEQKLFEGALAGMMEQLDDPHSVYIGPALFTDFEQQIGQEFGGVGIQIVIDPDSKQITIVSPLFGTPAWDSGIRPRDRILKLDGKSTQGMSLDEAAGLMKGKPGTPIVLTVQHEDEAKPADIRIVRAVIQKDSVLGDTRNPDGTWNYFLEGRERLGYVHIDGFGERTADEMEKAMRTLVAGKAKGLVLDLRNDPGGLLREAVSICDMFLDSGVIVTTRGRDGEIWQSYEAKPDGTFPTIPVAILVNKYTASASEIVAACLQDHQRAVVVGERTYGKGTVQEIVYLPGNEGALKLTIASYWRPSGKNINKGTSENGDWGVSPDPGFEVKLEGDQLKRWLRWQQEVGFYRASVGPRKPNGAKPSSLPIDIDPQLAKAVEYIEEQAAPKQLTSGPYQDEGGLHE